MRSGDICQQVTRTRSGGAAAGSAVLVIVVLDAAVLLALAACSGGSPASLATVTASVTRTVSATVPAPASGAAPAGEPVTGSPPPAGGSAAATVVVPDGVGLDYQRAQDLWRGAGLHVAPAVDALGAHRLPVIDSNWIVLSQSPKAGSNVAAGSFITATVKKKSDE